MKKIYLAIPYTGNEKKSFETANRVAAIIYNAGFLVFSPISHTHPICVQCKLPSDFSFWKALDKSFVDWCDEVWVITESEFEVSNSKGVQSEMGMARSAGKPIRFIKKDITTSDILRNEDLTL